MVLNYAGGEGAATLSGHFGKEIMRISSGTSAENILTMNPYEVEGSTFEKL